MGSLLSELQNKIGEEVRENVLLAPYTLYKIGGAAEYFLAARNEDQIIKAVQTGQELELPLTFLGGGSNVLVNTAGVEGLVIRMRNGKLLFANRTLEVGAGCSLGRLVNESVDRGLTGLEWAAGIPGTVGGAIYGNAGAYGREIADFLVSVKVYNGKEALVYPKEKLEFRYRDSCFKKEKKGEVILSAVLKLENNPDPQKSKREIKEHLQDREKKHPLEYPNAGCVFKNVKLKSGKAELLYPAQGFMKPELRKNLPSQYIERGVIPAFYLIERADLKGYQIGGVRISTKHANFLVKVGKATSDHVLMLISYIKQQVRDRFGIQLKEELRLIGFD